MSDYSIGKRIKENRQKFKVSQEQLALKADITTAYLGQIERDERNPTVKIVERIATAFGMSLSEFFENQTTSKDNETSEYINQIIFELGKVSPAERKELLDIIQRIVRLKYIK